MSDTGSQNGFDLGGGRLLDIMEGKDVEWLDPPLPNWRLMPPTFISYYLKGGFRASDYDSRLTALLEAVLEAYPGSLVTYAHAPEGLAGEWEEGPDQPEMPKYWKIPKDARAKEMMGWLRDGGWSIWRPSKEPEVLNFGGSTVPRYMAEDALKHAREHAFDYLLTSTWDNRFTFFAINPERHSAGGEAKDDAA